MQRSTLHLSQDMFVLALQPGSLHLPLFVHSGQNICHHFQSHSHFHQRCQNSRIFIVVTACCAKFGTNLLNQFIKKRLMIFFENLMIYSTLNV